MAKVICGGDSITIAKLKKELKIELVIGEDEIKEYSPKKLYMSIHDKSLNIIKIYKTVEKEEVYICAISRHILDKTSAVVIHTGPNHYADESKLKYYLRDQLLINPQAKPQCPLCDKPINSN
jgi:hypothetical protein